MIVVSECGRILRIGSRIYVRTDAEYKVLESFGERIKFSDELSATDEFFAIACRQKSASRDLTRKQRSPARAATSEQGHNAVKIDSEPSGTIDSDVSASESCSEDSDSEEEPGPEAAAAEPKYLEPSVSDSDSFRTRSSQSSLSARSSNSEGSTDFKSDEIEDEALMNDFDSDSDPEDFNTDDDAGSLEGSSSIMEPATGLDGRSLNSSSSRSSSSTGRSPRSGSPRSRIAASRRAAFRRAAFESNSTESESGTDDESAQSDSEASSGYESSVDSDDEYDSDEDEDEDDSDEDDAGMRLGELLEPRRKHVKNGTRCEVQVFRNIDAGQPPQRVFRFKQLMPSPLFASPPVFHPTKSLMVWPLGDGDILFADYANNTYFVRRMRFGYRRSCQISVQCRFSSCSAFLHIISLDGFIYKDKDGDNALGLRMHVSTHRLSERKTTRSPPRLVFRTALNLPAAYTETIQLSVSSLPYTITWAEKHIYVTHSETPLRVYRIPLFREVEELETTETAPKAVFVNAAEVYLPSSVEMRKVYFFDGDLQTQKKKSKNKEQYVAEVVIGALNRTVVREGLAEGAGPRCGQVLPQGVHLTESQFGKWEGVDLTSGNSNVEKLQRAETWRGGHLDAKFERFDRTEDCDIVPYLGF